MLIYSKRTETIRQNITLIDLSWDYSITREDINNQDRSRDEKQISGLEGWYFWSFMWRSGSQEIGVYICSISNSLSDYGTNH